MLSEREQIILYSVYILSQRYDVAIQMSGAKAWCLLQSSNAPRNIQAIGEYTKQIFAAHTVAFTRTGFVPQLNIMSLWQFARVTTNASEIKVCNLSGE